MAFEFPFATPLADWSGPGLWILLVPVVWFALALLFVFVLRRIGWAREWGGGCGSGRHHRERWEDERPGPPGGAWRDEGRPRA